MNEKYLAETFLKQYGMHHSSIHPETTKKEFQLEMQAGLSGITSSLDMIPTYLSVPNKPIPTDKPIIVVDAGGTNFRVAVLTFLKGEEPKIEKFSKTPMPGTFGPLTAEQFFEEIVLRLEPVIHESPVVGFCFSYPSKTLPNLDGELIELTKEVDVSGVKGLRLGEELNKRLKQRGLPQKEFVVLNDTVAALLGGIAKESMFTDSLVDPTRFIGFIYGTGLNTCYPEHTKNITKSKNAMACPDQMIVNIESGGFSKFPHGVFDERLDSTTHNPSIRSFEKMTSGAYFGGMVHIMLKQAMANGIFSEKFCKDYEYENEVPLWDINDFFLQYGGQSPLSCLCYNEDDCQFLYHTLDAMLERSAKMMAIHFGAIISQMGISTSPTNPVLITAEGTTFEKTFVFRQHLDKYMKELCNDSWKQYCKFITVEHVTLAGAAVAGLMK